MNYSFTFFLLQFNNYSYLCRVNFETKNHVT